VNTHLVRAEQRAGAVWYELAHDRLIEPLRTNNTAWRDAHFNKVQKRASIWEAEGHPKGLLLLGEDLVEAQRWAAEQGVATEIEKQFLDASAEAQAARQRERLQTQLVGWAAIVATIFFLIAAVAGVYGWVQSKHSAKSLEAARRSQKEANWKSWQADGQSILAERSADQARLEGMEADQQRDLAKQQTELALARQLVAQAGTLTAEYPNRWPLATLLALESMKRHSSLEADEFLRRSVTFLGNKPIRQQSHVRAGVFSPDGRFVATAGEGEAGGVRVSDAVTGKQQCSMGRNVESLAFSPDGRYLATAASDGSAQVWLAGTGKPVGEPVQLEPVGKPVILVFSPSDGHYLAAGSGDTISVWPVQGSRSELFKTRVEGPNHRGQVPTIVPIFTPDAKWLIASGIHSIQLWEVAGWKPLKAILLPRFPWQGWRTAISPDGRYLAAGNRIYGIPGENPVATLTTSAGDVDPSFSQDGSYLATVSGSVVDVWSVPGKASTTGPSSQAAPAPWDKFAEIKQEVSITGVVFNPGKGYLAAASDDGTATFLATASDDGIARIWRLPSKSGSEASEVARMNHPSSVVSLALNPAAAMVATRDSDNIFRLWTLDWKEELIESYSGVDGRAPAISVDGRFFALRDDNGIQAFEAKDGSLVAQLDYAEREPNRSISYFDIDSDGRHLMLQTNAKSSAGKTRDSRPALPSGRVEGNAWEIWEISNASAGSAKSKVSRTTWWPRTDSPGNFLFSPDAKYMVTDEQTGLQILNNRTGKTSIAAKCSNGVSQACGTRFFFSPNGRFLAVQNQNADRKIHIWDTERQTERSPLLLPGGDGRMAFSADGQFLSATANTESENKLYVWRVDGWHVEGNLLQKADLKIHRNTAFALSPDGQYLAKADLFQPVQPDETEVSVWQRGSSGFLRLPGSIHLKQEVKILTFSSDGRYLAITTATGIKVWDRQKGEGVASVETPLAKEGTEGNQFTSFNPDGKYLLSIVDVDNVSVWFWGAERLFPALCAHLTSNLSKEEWDQYLPGEPYRKTCPDLPVGGEIEADLSPAAQAIGSRGRSR
jgi:WD40 repeat protein